MKGSRRSYRGNIICNPNQALNNMPDNMMRIAKRSFKMKKVFSFFLVFSSSRLFFPKLNKFFSHQCSFSYAFVISCQLHLKLSLRVGWSGKIMQWKRSAFFEVLYSKVDNFLTVFYLWSNFQPCFVISLEVKLLYLLR